MSISAHSRRTALITGSAGQIGQKISEHLSSQSKQSIGLYRNQLPKAINNFLPLCADLLTADSIAPALKSTDTVIHLAWQGGVLGSTNLQQFKPTDAQIQLSSNVLMTQNIVRTMERAQAQKIIFLSWVGVERSAQNTMLREKYWAENIILNSNIPEKIIIRAGVIGTGLQESEFIKAAAAISKLPLILPLPRQVEGIVLTTIKDILSAIDDALKQKPQGGGCKIIDLTSTKPLSGASIVTALESKVWGKNRLTIGGVVGDVIFKWAEGKFGAAKPNEPRLTDFFRVSKITQTHAVDGLPPVVFGIESGQKTEAINAI